MISTYYKLLRKNDKNKKPSKLPLNFIKEEKIGKGPLSNNIKNNNLL